MAGSWMTDISLRPDAISLPRSARSGQAGALVVAVAVCAAALAALFVDHPGDSLLLGVLIGLSIIWALAGAWLARHRPWPIAWLALAIGGLIAAGTLTWAIDASSVVERLTLTIGPAMVAHLVLALPDGRLERRGHRTLVALTYVAGLGLGLLLLTDRDQVLLWPVALAWLMPLAVAPAANGRYRRASALERRQMQWFGWAISVALEIALVAAALHVLTGWPDNVGIIALMASATLPASLVAGSGQRLGARVDRLLAHTVSLTGLTLLIVAAYVVAVIAFGRKPNDGERTLLLLSMVAAAGAALAFQPARTWLSERANRLVYGERVAPDEALRTWGSRLTRAIPLDELLLQLVEALRASMQLTSAQVWTGTGGHLELAAAVPHVDRPAFTVGRQGAGGRRPCRALRRDLDRRLVAAAVERLPPLDAAGRPDRPCRVAARHHRLRPAR